MRCKKCTYLIFTTVITFLVISGCKESPSFPVTNENDPLHEDFVLPVPKNLDISTVFRDSSFIRMNVFWDAAENRTIIDGYILKGFDSESMKFIEIKRLPGNARGLGHLLYEDDIGLKLDFQVHSFITYNEDSIRISEPATVSYDQTIEHFKASITKSGTNKLSWNHNIITSKANFYIERSINNSNFELVSEVDNRTASFIDKVDFSIHDEIRYRIFAKTEFLTSDTLYANSDPIQLQPPQSIKFLNSDEHQINLAIVHTSFAESFQVTLIKPDQTTYSTFEVPFSGNDSTFFTLEDIPNTDEFSVLVRSEFQNNISSSTSTKLKKVPYLNYSQSVTLPAEEYIKPKLSEDGTTLTYLTYNNDYYHANVNVIDIANNQIIPLPDKVHSLYNTYDYLNEQELIYTVDEEFIRAWDLEGNEIENWEHLANDEVYDMFINYEAQKGVFKYNEKLNVYDLTNNSLNEQSIDGINLIPSENKDYIFVYNSYGNFFIQKLSINDLNTISQLSTDFIPDKVLIGPNDDIILISENTIRIYDSTNFNLLMSIESDFGAVRAATIINQSKLAFISNLGYLNFFDINTGDFLGQINLYDYETSVELPNLDHPKLFYSDISKNFFILGVNELAIYTLTEKWTLAYFWAK